MIETSLGTIEAELDSARAADDGHQLPPLRRRSCLRRRPLPPHGAHGQPAEQRREDRSDPGVASPPIAKGRDMAPSPSSARVSPRSGTSTAPFPWRAAALIPRHPILHLHRRAAGARLRRKAQRRRPGLRGIRAGHQGARRRPADPGAARGGAGPRATHHDRADRTTEVDRMRRSGIVAAMTLCVLCIPGSGARERRRRRAAPGERLVPHAQRR